MRLARAVAVAWAALALVPASLRAGISVAPAFVEVALDQGRATGRFEIANLGDTEERYRLRALHFRFSRSGDLQRLPPDEQSLASWIKFNPAELTVPPKSSRVIRFVIVPRRPLPPGEYWGAMELENLTRQAAQAADESGHEYKVEVVTSVLVPIFGTVGQVRYAGTFDELHADRDEKGPRLEVLLTNRGTGRLLVKGTYEIVTAAGEVVETAELGYAYVLPGEERVFSAHVKASLPEGSYTVRVRYEVPQLEQPLERETALAVGPSPPAAESAASAGAATQVALQPSP